MKKPNALIIANDSQRSHDNHAAKADDPPFTTDYDQHNGEPNSPEQDSLRQSVFSLYIHIPWCVKKCPYCDFNSHEGHNKVDYERYTKQLLADLKQELATFAEQLSQRQLVSIFIGGGTPSLMPTEHITYLLSRTRRLLLQQTKTRNWSAVEVTLEVNPGTHEYADFKELRKAGITRISLGCQSFNNDFLQTLGRIHSASNIYTAFEKARSAGFTNINIDLMYALPKQSLNQALCDLKEAIDLTPEHISWYQLTLEPNTAFYSRPPEHLPSDDLSADMAEAGQRKLANAGFEQYEVSAYAKEEKRSLHNLNYWRFGDYLAIGAGAHGKMTIKHARVDEAHPHACSHAYPEIVRYQKTRSPQDYLKTTPPSLHLDTIEQKAIAFEYMLNRLRLNDAIRFEEWQRATGQAASQLSALTENNDLFIVSKHGIELSTRGRVFLDDAVSCFL